MEHKDTKKKIRRKMEEGRSKKEDVKKILVS